MKLMKKLEKEIQKLSPDLKQEVEDFVEFLLRKRARKKGKTLKQSWGGALKSYRGEFSSLELQKKALEWRGD